MIFFFFFIFFASFQSICKANYVEQAIIKPLKSGNLYTHFQFTNQAEIEIGEKHFNLFPKTIAKVMQKFDILELHLSFTQGRWQHSKWGSPIVDAPVGAELWVSFNETNKTIVDKLWIGLSNALSGMSCASLQFMDGKVSTQPSLAYSAKMKENSILRRAVLPREMVCTENLTPWLKLLPCGGTGLAHLINPLRVYQSNYHSQATHATRHCDADGLCHVDLTQTVSLVLPTNAKRDSRDWSLYDIFGRPVQRCAVARDSSLFVMVPDDAKPDTLSITPDAVLSFDELQLGEEFARGYSQVARYGVTDDANLHKLAQWFLDATPVRGAVTPFAGVQALRGASESNWLRFELSRGADESGADELVQFVWYDAIPWQLRFYWHTMKCSLNGNAVELNDDDGGWFDSVRLESAEPRVSSNVIELSGSLARNDRLVCRVFFERAFMHWTEFPPDAHRGYDMGAAVLELSSTSTASGSPRHWSPLSSAAEDTTGAKKVMRRIYTQSMQVIMPTPDFSMPYNVICLSGTMWGLFFGNTFSVLTRRLGLLRKGNQFVSDRPTAKLMRWIKSKLKRD